MFGDSMADAQENKRFVFPRWANYLLPLLLLGGLGGAMYAPVFVVLGLNPDSLNKGYMPEQPVPYSHQVHVGQLGIDCRYCHTTVDYAAFASVPPTQTCINCHAPSEFPQDYSDPELAGQPTNLVGIHQDSSELRPVWESYFSGESIEWVKVHDLPDYAYFNHSAHVNKGIGCYSCHGRVDQMGEEGVYQVHNLSMGWCIDCHRAPEEHLRPLDQVTSMTYHTGLGPNDLQAMEGESLAEAQQRVGTELKEKYNTPNMVYMTACSTCHR